MLKIDHCPCCGSARLKAYPALTAAFIADYVLLRGRERVNLLECLDCAFRFYEDRFDGAETQRLYSGYRGESYFKARHRREPWYTRGINDGIGGAPDEIAARNAVTLDVVRAESDPGRFESVLDYGGDRGQFIPAALGKRRAVFDLSGAAPVDGVEAIASKEALAARRFDFVMLANVLEHSADPRRLLEELRPLLADGDPRLLVSVPHERTRLGFVPGPANRLYGRLLAAAAASPLLGKLLDFYSAVFRVKFSLVPPLGYLTLHEHINFFDDASLRALLDAAGFEPLHSRTVASHQFAAFEASILCLARPKANTAPPADQG